MILLVESIIFCLIFTIIAGGMTYLKPLSMINRYPPAIQEKAFVVHKFNNANSFIEGFKYSYIL